MLYEEYYCSGFKPRPEKEGVSFLTSVSNGNGNSQNNDHVFPNGFLKFNNEEKDKCFSTSNTESDAFSSPFLGMFPEDEKATWKGVASWNIPIALPVEKISLDDLASAHLQNHKLSANSTSSALTMPSEKVSAKFCSRDKVMTAEAEDNLERMDDVDIEVKKACLDTIVIGVKELSLQEKCPSSFGHVLCHKVRYLRKKMVFCDTGFHCPPQIEPFDFTTASPDDIVRNNQKLRNNFWAGKKNL